MLFLSSKHHFDTMFVILCVIAGAISHSISNTSKTPINQLNNHLRASFMDFILDLSLVELLQSSNSINEGSTIKYSLNHKSTATNGILQSQTVCALLSNLLSSNQLKYCHRHQDVLATVLPQVAKLTRRECARITSDLRWNCTTFDFLLDRSNPLAFTKEAALVRSILNASMMYLVVKACSDSSHLSCGCQSDERYPNSANIRRSRFVSDLLVAESNVSKDQSSLTLDQQDFSPSDLSKLDAGSPLRLTKSINRRQGCSANTGFASALTKVFFDSDDTKALNKAYRILNEEMNYNSNRSSNVKHLVDSDYRDLAHIKWTKSAISLHNNNVGRQMVHQATQRRCRCHGLSGVCQFQTCWDHLLDFDTITSNLRTVYLNESRKVEAKNFGTFEKPDLYLIKSELLTSSSASYHTRFIRNMPSEGVREDSKSNSSSSLDLNIKTTDFDRVNPGELLYLYSSPEYCEPQAKIRHPGTRGRACAPSINVNTTTKASKKSQSDAGTTRHSEYIGRSESLDGSPGSCEHLCCSRGYYSELVLDMVTCNCRFTFCCRVDCEHCLHQRRQHYCL